jgi:hypothetical protein
MPPQLGSHIVPSRDDGTGHAIYQITSTVSVAGGDTTLDNHPRATFGIQSAAADQVCATQRTPPRSGD